MTDIYRHETYEGREGEIFTIHADDNQSIELKLVELSQFEYPHQYAFSVVFRGPEDRYVLQGTYKVEHAELGKLEMFLVPIMYPSREPGVYYEFGVNQLLEFDK